jgi:hypothetical protein
LNEYEIVKKGYENRITEIMTGSEQRVEGELRDLICAYRELTYYIKNDPTYELKRRLFGLLLIETMGRKCEQNG